ncbi:MULTISPECIES: di-trans,poly-cis-decaprenylcistransferase [Arcobacteraceae]|uniref:Isoprenyl transferase n=2 Tax=Arcobacteraceae TaxID=2808963 RepID=A0ABX2YC02_9BACT|nr:MULTISPECIES: di-trans,poly-cis-decaprenylcistransferase [Arcobacteraceae]OCL83081.1 Isoprenyl transferase [Arcobacter porcinus]OCL83427.1 Isoprenyl transferase [Arcobacter porcinus]OCL92516.1 Isoprenyl transferase [Arcobacter porcinus]OCL93738.1 Isoprenyl transferase [Aliarcobacter thereius]OCL95146.1 Isoprenyl transferase [Aliarcobacter thereius LMG 24486]
MEQTSNNSLNHIAIIMDGNGRWAKNKGLNRTAGHEEGAKVVREITTYCAKIGIKYLTLYAFSTENWARPKLEIEYLMKLLDKYLKNELKTLMENSIRFKAIGDLSKFSKALQKTIKDVEEKTADNKNLTQVLALNYGSKDEIIRAIKKLTEKNLEINEKNFEACLDTAEIGNVDLLIRTSGEIRLSNYLLWQNAYAEMFFTSTLWPDFNSKELENIIEEFYNRQRRFGGV